MVDHSGRIDRGREGRPRAGPSERGDRRRAGVGARRARVGNVHVRGERPRLVEVRSVPNIIRPIGKVCVGRNYDEVLCLPLDALWKGERAGVVELARIGRDVHHRSARIADLNGRAVFEEDRDIVLVPEVEGIEVDDYFVGDVVGETDRALRAAAASAASPALRPRRKGVHVHHVSVNGGNGRAYCAASATSAAAVEAAGGPGTALGNQGLAAGHAKHRGVVSIPPRLKPRRQTLCDGRNQPGACGVDPDGNNHVEGIGGGPT